MPRIAFRPLVLIAVLALMAVIVGAQAPVPQPEDQETAREVVDLVERNHMAHPQINDEIAVKWCDNFIKKLDPQKYHFLKSDVAEFRKEARGLDDQIREGNIAFAHKVFDRFLERSDERFKAELDLLKQKFDYTKDEAFNEDFDKIDFPADKAQADERLRKKVKLDLLIGKVVEDLNEANAVSKWKIRYKDRNRLWHQVDSSELLELYLSSLTETFDPHSSFLSQKNLEDLLNYQQAPPPARRHRGVTAVRGRLRRGRAGSRPGDGRRQGRPPPARGQDHRHPEGKRGRGRPRREEAQRCRPLHPWPSRHQGPVDRPAGGHEGGAAGSTS